jgi:hypothetical protein
MLYLSKALNSLRPANHLCFNFREEPVLVGSLDVRYPDNIRYSGDRHDTTYIFIFENNFIRLMCSTPFCLDFPFTDSHSTTLRFSFHSVDPLEPNAVNLFVALTTHEVKLMQKSEKGVNYFIVIRSTRLV